MIHTAKCQEQKKRFLATVVEWRKKHPFYCRTCNGAGGKQYGGHGYIPPEFDECKDCTALGLCPLCGSCYIRKDTDAERDELAEFVSENKPCKFCGEMFGSSCPSDEGDPCECEIEWGRKQDEDFENYARGYTPE